MAATIRRLRTTEATALQTLRQCVAEAAPADQRDAWTVNGSPTVEVCQTDLDRSFVFGAFLEGTLRGTVAVDVVPNPFAALLGPSFAGLDLGIRAMAVHPDARRQNIARLLMLRCIAHARRRRARQVLLEVHPWNFAARGLYDSLAFRVWSEPGDEMVRMCMLL